MNVTFELQNSVGVIAIEGELDASSATEFDQFFQKHAKETNNFVLNLEKVDFIDSTGLGRIIAALRYLSEADGDIRLCGINIKIMLVFQITRAHRIFDIYDDKAEAIKSFDE